MGLLVAQWEEIVHGTVKHKGDIALFNHQLQKGCFYFSEESENIPFGVSSYVAPPIFPSTRIVVNPLTFVPLESNTNPN